MNYIEKRTERILLFIILLTGGTLRLYNYAGFSLSNDELSALARLRFNSFSELIEKGVKTDFHPAGVQVFLFYWTKFFGISENAVRLPFVIMGIASVYLVYLIGKKWFNVAAGLLAAATLCVLEFPILYSQIARPYSPGLFFTLLAAYSWSEIFSERIRNNSPGKPKSVFLSYAGFVIVVGACMYTHYFALLQAGIFCLAGLFFLSKENYKAYFIAGVVILLLYVPHLQIFLYQMSIGGIGGEAGWLGKPGSDFFWKYLRYAFNNSNWLLIIFLVLLIFSIFFFNSSRGKNKFRLLAFLFFILPLLIGYFYSIFRNPVLQNSILLFSFPFFLLFMFSFITEPPKKILVSGVVVLLVIGSFSTVFQNKYYSTDHFAVFRELAEKTIEFNKKYGEQNITRTINIHNPYYINYYFEKFKKPVRFEQYLCHEYVFIKDFIRIVEKSSTDYFLHAWSNIYDLPEIAEVIRQKYPYIASKVKYFNSQITLYAKNKNEPFKEENPIFFAGHDFEKAKWSNDTSFMDSAKAYSGKYSVFMDSTQEYSPTFFASVNNLNLKEGGIIKMEVNVYSPKTELKAKIVISIDDAEKNIYWSANEIGNFLIYKNQWQKVFLVRNINFSFKGDEVVKAFIWNDNKEIFYLDDFKISVYKK